MISWIALPRLPKLNRFSAACQVVILTALVVIRTAQVAIRTTQVLTRTAQVLTRMAQRRWWLFHECGVSIPQRQASEVLRLDLVRCHTQ